MAATDGNLSAIRVCFGGGVDRLLWCGWCLCGSWGDVIEVDGEEGVGACNALSVAVSVGVDALAGVAHFI